MASGRERCVDRGQPMAKPPKPPRQMARTVGIALMCALMIKAGSRDIMLAATAPTHVIRRRNPGFP